MKAMWILKVNMVSQREEIDICIPARGIQRSYLKPVMQSHIVTVFTACEHTDAHTSDS